MKKPEYKVWQCRIYVHEDAILPNGFDSPPRCAAERAITDEGIEVVANFSGWGERPYAGEVAVIDHNDDVFLEDAQ